MTELIPDVQALESAAYIVIIINKSSSKINYKSSRNYSNRSSSNNNRSSFSISSKISGKQTKNTNRWGYCVSHY